MEPTKGVKLRESASRDVAGDLWLVILEEALEHHSCALRNSSYARRVSETQMLRLVYCVSFIITL